MTNYAWNTIATAINLVITALLVWKVMWLVGVARRALIALRDNSPGFNVRKVLAYLGIIEDEDGD